MYSIYQGICVAIALVTIAFGGIGVALAIELETGADAMEVLETILQYFGAFFMLVAGVFVGLIKWLQRQKDLDPISSYMLEKVLRSLMRPMIERLDRMEETQLKMIEYLGQQAGEEAGKKAEAPERNL